MNQNLKSVSLLEVLLQQGVLSATNVLLVEAFMNKWQVACYDAITETRLVSEEKIKRELGKYFSLTVVDSLVELSPDPECLDMLSFTEACRLSALPLSRSNSSPSVVQVAVADPTGLATIDSLKKAFDCEVELVLGGKSEIMRAIYTSYSPEHQLRELMNFIKSGSKVS